MNTSTLLIYQDVCFQATDHVDANEINNGPAV